MELLETVAPNERAYPMANYLRGLAVLRLKNGTQAAAQFRKILDHRGANWGPLYPSPIYPSPTLAWHAAPFWQEILNWPVRLTKISLRFGKMLTRMCLFSFKCAKNTPGSQNSD
jgi:hypothetical protein